MKRIWHRYEKWEDYQAGMWRLTTTEERKQLHPIAVQFTGNADLYGSYMMRVAKEWPIACEHNLTERNMNRQAWIGHAAACLALGLPEDVTRAAWAQLTKEQQDAANLKAQEAIDFWEANYAKKDS